MTFLNIYFQTKSYKDIEYLLLYNLIKIYDFNTKSTLIS